VAKDDPTRGRTTPKGTQPTYVRPVGGRDIEAPPIDSLIDLAALDVVGAADPFEVEAWASAVIAILDTARRRARMSGLAAPPLEQAVLERCRERGGRRALAVAAGLSAVLPPPLDAQAREVVDELRRSAVGPTWIDALGREVPTRAWIASDVFGDQDSLIIGFAQPDGSGDHAIVALVDHNLSGQAKDAFLVENLAAVVTEWKANDDPHLRIEEVPVEAAFDRLRDALEASDLWSGDTELRTEDFAELHALMWARLRRAGHDEPRSENVNMPRPERASIVAKFLASKYGRAARTALAPADVELLTTYLVDLRCDYEGRPLRWSPGVAARVLTDLAPRKLVLDPANAAAFPGVMGAFVRFAGAQTRLDDLFVSETLDTIRKGEKEFFDRIDDPSAAGPAKAMIALLQARGVDLADLDAVNAALTDLSNVELEARPRRAKPTPPPPAIVEAADRTTVLARCAVLVDFYGEGRKLTETGRPTLADARTLVGLLGTSDRFDSTIGDRTFKTMTTADLPELTFTIRWATAAGALRKERGSLRATASWRKLDSKPIQRWTKAADALVALGPLTGFHADSRYRAPDEIVDEFLDVILDELRGHPMPFDAMLDMIAEQADAAYEWRTLLMQDPDNRRTSFGWDLDRLARILGWAGIVERIGATAEPAQWERSGEGLVGGTLQLTDLGEWWLGPPDGSPH